MKKLLSVLLIGAAAAAILPGCSSVHEGMEIDSPSTSPATYQAEEVTAKADLSEGNDFTEDELVYIENLILSAVELELGTDKSAEVLVINQHDEITCSTYAGYAFEDETGASMCQMVLCYLQKVDGIWTPTEVREHSVFDPAQYHLGIEDGQIYLLANEAE